MIFFACTVVSVVVVWAVSSLCEATGAQQQALHREPDPHSEKCVSFAYARELVKY